MSAIPTELRNDVHGSTFVNFIPVLRLPMPQALPDAALRWRRRDEYRSGYVARWAPLTILAR